MSVENVASGLVPQGQKASDYDNLTRTPKTNVCSFSKKPDSSNPGVQEIGESSSRNIDNIDVHSFSTTKVMIMMDQRSSFRTVRAKVVRRTRRMRDQTVIRNKADLLLRSFAQEEGFDFEESFDPVARLGSSSDFRFAQRSTHSRKGLLIQIIPEKATSQDAFVWIKAKLKSLTLIMLDALILGKEKHLEGIQFLGENRVKLDCVQRN
ncbi:hypothetical protein Tco_1313257 [Tanacetum coccineum]